MEQALAFILMTLLCGSPFVIAAYIQELIERRKR